MNQQNNPTQTVSLAYGKESRTVEVPTQNLAGILIIRPWYGLDNPHDAVRDSLLNPIGTPPLYDLAYGKKDAVVVISDITRPVPNQLLLGPILETLHQAGIPSEKILILIATGMHRAATPQEMEILVGREILSHYRVENHIGTDIESHQDLGIQEGGIPLQVDRRYLEADLKVLTGLIEPHLLAGYSGGRKAVLPGVCSLETLKVMHGFRVVQHPRTITGNLDDNPFHLKVLELVRKIGADFIVNVTLNKNREVTGVFSGDLDLAHRAGVAALEEYVIDTIDEPVDIAITCGGGFPLDQTLYQAIKGMVAAKEILKPGGTIIFTAEMSQGLGSESFCDLIQQLTTPVDFLHLLEEKDYHQMDQWMLQDHLNVCTHAGAIYTVTEGLSEEMILKSFMQPYESLQAALEAAMQNHGPDARIAALPQGPYVIGKMVESACA